jgi:hypothetical protein
MGCLAQPFTWGDCANRLQNDLDKIPSVMKATRAALARLADQMPNAQVVLVGYPTLTSPTCIVGGASSSAIKTLQNTFNSAQNEMISALNLAKHTSRFHYLSLHDWFLGHGPCALTLSQRWINRNHVPLWPSYHPNKIGNDQIAALLFPKFPLRKQ